MNREKALEFFRNEIEEIEAQKLTPLDWQEDFKAAFTALSSCACEGREPVDECGAGIYDVRGGTARASAHIKVYDENLKEGQVLHCLVFLPAGDICHA